MNTTPGARAACLNNLDAGIDVLRHDWLASAATKYTADLQQRAVLVLERTATEGERCVWCANRLVGVGLV